MTLQYFFLLEKDVFINSVTDEQIGTRILSNSDNNEMEIDS